MRVLSFSLSRSLRRTRLMFLIWHYNHNIDNWILAARLPGLYWEEGEEIQEKRASSSQLECTLEELWRHYRQNNFRPHFKLPMETESLKIGYNCLHAISNPLLVRAHAMRRPSFQTENRRTERNVWLMDFFLLRLKKHCSTEHNVTQQTTLVSYVL